MALLLIVDILWVGSAGLTKVRKHASVGVVSRISAVHYTVGAAVSLVWPQISSLYANLGAYEVMNHVDHINNLTVRSL